ncbi:MAG: hypothetical protein O7A03_09450 [Alphaproteobacteria bacterium]|nr:hypothetical protein [Alphaproteobacteria bacterium]
MQKSTRPQSAAKVAAATPAALLMLSAGTMSNKPLAASPNGTNKVFGDLLEDGTDLDPDPDGAETDQPNPANRDSFDATDPNEFNHGDG